MKKNRVDIVQTFFFDSTIFGIMAARLAGIKNTVSCRRDMGFWYDNGIKRKIKIVNRLTKRVLVNSSAIKKFIILEEKLNEKKVDVIYNGIDLQIFKRAAAIESVNTLMKVKRENVMVGIVGNFNRRVKRFDLFIHAAGEIIKRHRNIKFVIVGGGVLEAELRRLASVLCIAENVIFVGKKEDPIPYIKCFDIGVLPSDSEGFSNVLLEYMACKIPIVATRVGGNSELIEHMVSGLLVPYSDHLALADAICELIQNVELRNRLGTKARKIVAERYSWDKKIKEFESYYIKLIEQ